MYCTVLVYIACKTCDASDNFLIKNEIAQTVKCVLY